jgi:hypothetical protein
VLVPRVIRDDARYATAAGEQVTDVATKAAIEAGK